MTMLDHRPRPMPWIAAAIALLVIHKLRLIAWYALDDDRDRPDSAVP